MSKFLYLGMQLEKFPRATKSAPAAATRLQDPLGMLQAGRVADIVLLGKPDLPKSATAPSCSFGNAFSFSQRPVLV